MTPPADTTRIAFAALPVLTAFVTIPPRADGRVPGRPRASRRGGDCRGWRRDGTWTGRARPAHPATVPEPPPAVPPVRGGNARRSAPAPPRRAVRSHRAEPRGRRCRPRPRPGRGADYVGDG